MYEFGLGCLPDLTDPDNESRESRRSEHAPTYLSMYAPSVTGVKVDFYARSLFQTACRPFFFSTMCRPLHGAIEPAPEEVPAVLGGALLQVHWWCIPRWNSPAGRFLGFQGFQAGPEGETVHRGPVPGRGPEGLRSYSPPVLLSLVRANWRAWRATSLRSIHSFNQERCRSVCECRTVPDSRGLHLPFPFPFLSFPPVAPFLLLPLLLFLHPRHTLSPR